MTMYEVKFEELSQELREAVTGACDIDGVHYKILKCEKGASFEQCFIESDGIVGIFVDAAGKSVSCIWLGKTDITFLYESICGISDMRKKGGSAKSETKAASSRENGRKGGRPREINEVQE